jgi:hypothetical protein
MRPELVQGPERLRRARPPTAGQSHHLDALTHLAAILNKIIPLVIRVNLLKIHRLIAVNASQQIEQPAPVIVHMSRSRHWRVSLCRSSTSNISLCQMFLSYPLVGVTLAHAGSRSPGRATRSEPARQAERDRIGTNRYSKSFVEHTTKGR